MGDGRAKGDGGAWDALVVNHRLLELAVRELEHRLRPEPGRQKGLREKLSVGWRPHRLLLRLRLRLQLLRLLRLLRLLHHVLAPLCAQQSARGEPRMQAPAAPARANSSSEIEFLEFFHFSGVFWFFRVFF